MLFRSERVRVTLSRWLLLLKKSPTSVDDSFCFISACEVGGKRETRECTSRRAGNGYGWGVSLMGGENSREGLDFVEKGEVRRELN